MKGTIGKLKVDEMDVVSWWGGQVRRSHLLRKRS